MADNDWLGKIFSVAGAAWVAAAMLAVRLFHTWPNVMARINERRRDAATEKSDDWQRVRDERDHALQQVETLRALLAECERLSIERLGRAITAEATLLGLGEGRNIATAQAVAERMTPKDKP